MDGIEIEVEGLEDVTKLLDELPTVVVKRCMRESLDEAVAVILEALAPLIPEHTGDLRAHIMFVINVDPDGQGASASIGFGDAGLKALWVEYGHRMVGHRPDRKELGEVKPHPFMRVAFEESGDAAVDKFIERFIELVNYKVVVIDNRSAA